MKLNFICRLLVVTLLIYSLNPLAAISQKVPKGNPVLFAEIFVGHAWSKAGGFTAGAGLNYQANRSLFNVRFLNAVKLRSEILSPFLPIPIIDQKSSLEEFSVLYGWRFINEGHAYSFSLGVSYNTFEEQMTDNNNQKFTRRTKYGGVPFEGNIQWFKREKKRFRIYGLIPVGRPSGFGGSLGMKLFGNLSKNSFAGLAITYGLGYHKKY